MSICYVMSPVGRLAVEADHDAVTRVQWASPGETSRDKSSSPVLTEAARQLDRYAPGTDFQKRVWALEGLVLR
jgi:methylated-DNA-[protein]-cysteine S-methyltransferase